LSIRIDEATGRPDLAPATAPRLRTDRSWWRLYVSILVVADALALLLGAVVARAAGFGALVPAGGVVSFVQVAMVLLPTWVMVLGLNGAYQRRWLGQGSDEYRKVLDAGLRFLAVVAIVAVVAGASRVRGLVAVSIPVATIASLIGRYCIRHAVTVGRRKGRFMKSVLIVGSEAASRSLLAEFVSVPYAGFRPIGACVPGDVSRIVAGDTTVRVLADPSRVLDAALMSRADAVAVADTTVLSNGHLRQLAWQLEGTGIDILVTPAVTDVAGPRISVRPVSALPLVYVEEPELKGPNRLAKGAFDFAVSGLALVVLAPLLLAIGLLVRATSRGPALFKQVRVGVGGRHFVVWKFRTMRRDAEVRLCDVLHLNEHDGLLFKVRDDPRVTRVGRFLRRWSLDELPQLCNVLRGDMSIVGPRPPLPSEVERYDDQIRRRLLVKPGMTGLWQVSGRSGLPWEEAVRLDLYYVENWSLSMDATIMAKTAMAVLKRHGAY